MVSNVKHAIFHGINILISFDSKGRGKENFYLFVSISYLHFMSYGPQPIVLHLGVMYIGLL